MKTEKLKCQACGKNFQREVVRGRKPSLCPKCKAKKGGK